MGALIDGAFCHSRYTISVRNRPKKEREYCWIQPSKTKMDLESSTSAASSASAVFRTQQSVLFSALIEKKLGLSLTWTKWRQKVLEIRSDATLWVRDPGATGDESNTSESGATLSNLTSAITQTIASPLQTLAPGLSPIESYSVAKVRLTQMNHNAMDGNGTDRDFGILLECDTTDGFETKVRFILNELQFHDFVQALHMVSRDHNLDAVRQLSITEQVQATSSQKHVSRRVGAVTKNASTMRITIAMAMDQVNTLSRVEQVVEKRGVFKWLPVYFSNDLVHGAWYVSVDDALFVPPPSSYLWLLLLLLLFVLRYIGGLWLRRCCSRCRRPSCWTTRIRTITSARTTPSSIPFDIGPLGY